MLLMQILLTIVFCGMWLAFVGITITFLDNYADFITWFIAIIAFLIITSLTIIPLCGVWGMNA